MADLKILEDEVHAAETAIRHYERELADRVRDVTALDGFVLSAMTTLLGTREAKVEAAIGRVAQTRAMLAAAKKAHAAAEARLAAARGEAQAVADAEHARTVELEHRADAIRATPHASSAELERIEAETDAAHVALASTMEALQAAMGALAAAGTVLRAIEKATTAAVADLGGLPLAEIWRLTESFGLRKAVEAYREKGARLQRALDATGMGWSVGGTDQPYDFGEGFTSELAQLVSLEDHRERFEWLRAELRALLEGFEGERRFRAAEIERLEAERRALLEGS